MGENDGLSIGERAAADAADVATWPNGAWVGPDGRLYPLASGQGHKELAKRKLGAKSADPVGDVLDRGFARVTFANHYVGVERSRRLAKPVVDALVPYLRTMLAQGDEVYVELRNGARYKHWKFSGDKQLGDAADALVSESVAGVTARPAEESLDEGRYGSEMTRLLAYLKDKPLDLAGHARDFVSWDGFDDVCDKAGVDADEARDLLWDDERDPDRDDAFYALCDKLEAAMTPDQKEDFAREALHSEDQPTWLHADLSVNTVLPRTTWLAHFGDDADKIAREGFRIGTDDVARLALTTYAHKSGAGYDFAFKADSKDARAQARTRNYGDHVALFQAAAVLIYHHGDEEAQAVFWGPSVKPNEIALLRYNRGNDEYEVTSRKGDKPLFAGTYDKCLAWVQTNHAQYRRQLFGESLDEGRGWPDNMEAKPVTRNFNYMSLGHGLTGAILWSMGKDGAIQTAVQVGSSDNHDDLGLRDDKTTVAWGRYEPKTRDCSVVMNHVVGRMLTEKMVKALATKFNIKTLYYFGDPMLVDPDLAAEFEGMGDTLDAYYDECGYVPLVGGALNERRSYQYESPFDWRKAKQHPAHFSRVFLRNDGFAVCEDARGWRLSRVRKGAIAETVVRMPRSGDWPKSLALRFADDYVRYDLNELAPPGWTGTVRAMIDKHPEIKNPYALSWAGYRKGYQSHYKPKAGDRRLKLAAWRKYRAKAHRRRLGEASAAARGVSRMAGVNRSVWVGMDGRGIDTGDMHHSQHVLASHATYGLTADDVARFKAEHGNDDPDATVNLPAIRHMLSQGWARVTVNATRPATESTVRAGDEKALRRGVTYLYDVVDGLKLVRIEVGSPVTGFGELHGDEVRRLVDGKPLKAKRYFTGPDAIARYRGAVAGESAIDGPSIGRLDETRKLVRNYAAHNLIIDLGRIGWFQCYYVTDDPAYKGWPNPLAWDKVREQVRKGLSDHSVERMKAMGTYDKPFELETKVDQLRTRAKVAILVAQARLASMGAKKMSDVLVFRDLSRQVNRITAGSVGGQAYRRSGKNKAYGTGGIEVDTGSSDSFMPIVIAHEWAHRFLFGQPKYVRDYVASVYDENIDKAAHGMATNAVVRTPVSVFPDFAKAHGMMSPKVLNYYVDGILDGKLFAQILALDAVVGGGTIYLTLDAPVEDDDKRDTRAAGEPVEVAIPAVPPTYPKGCLGDECAVYWHGTGENASRIYATRMKFGDLLARVSGVVWDRSLAERDGWTKEKIMRVASGDDALLKQWAADYAAVYTKSWRLTVLDNKAFTVFGLQNDEDYWRKEVFEPKVDIVKTFLGELRRNEAGDAMKKAIGWAIKQHVTVMNGGLGDPRQAALREELAKLRIAPSAYGAADLDEMFAVTVERISEQPRSVAPYLRKMIRDVFSGTVTDGMGRPNEWRAPKRIRRASNDW